MRLLLPALLLALPAAAQDAPSADFAGAYAGLRGAVTGEVEPTSTDLVGGIEAISYPYGGSRSGITCQTVHPDGSGGTPVDGAAADLAAPLGLGSLPESGLTRCIADLGQAPSEAEPAGFQADCVDFLERTGFDVSRPGPGSETDASAFAPSDKEFGDGTLARIACAMGTDMTRSLTIHVIGAETDTTTSQD